MALSQAGIACRLREVLLRDKPAELLTLSPKGTVPVLLLPEGRVLEESLDIMLWALSQHDPDQWLLPETGEMADMMALIETFDGPFKQALDRYKYPDRYRDEKVVKDVQRDRGADYLQALDAQLSPQGFLFGARISLADIALFPFIRQFANTDRQWFDVQPWPALHIWLEAHLQSDLFIRIMNKYKAWSPGAAEPLLPGNRA